MSAAPLDPLTFGELRRLVRSRPRSGRQSIAKASATRTLERLAREGPAPTCAADARGRYPHEPGDPFFELDWVFLHEHPAILQRHWGLAGRFRAGARSGPLDGIPTDFLGTSRSSDVDEERHGRR
jgi:hypothetical protein